MDDQTQRRYTVLRKRLLALEYKESFGVESLDIVEHLFRDLVTTTESYQSLYEKESKLSQDLALAQSQLFPLKKETARLLRENNQLHLEIVKKSEEVAAAAEQNQRQLRGLEDRLAESQFYSSQKDTKLAQLESEVDRLRAALQTQIDSGGRKADRRPMKPMDMSSPVHNRRPGVQPTQPRTPATDEANYVISSLREQIRALEENLRTSQHEKVKLAAAVSARENELSRLSRIVEENVTVTTQGLEQAHASNQRIIEQLNAQVDFLNEQLAQREAQISVMDDERRKLEFVAGEKELLDQRLEEAEQAKQDLARRLGAAQQQIVALNRLRTKVQVASAGEALAPNDENRAPASQTDAQYQDAIQSIQGNDQEWSSHVDALHNELGALTDGSHNLQQQLARSREQIDKLAGELRAMKTTKVALEGTIQDQTGQIHELQDELRRTQDTVTDLRLELNQAIEAREDYASRVRALEGETTETGAEASRLTRTIDMLKEEITNLRQRCAQLQAAKDKDEFSARRADGELEGLKSTAHILQQQLTERNARVSHLEVEMEKLNSQLHEERARADGLQQRLAHCEEMLKARAAELNEKSSKLAELLVLQSAPSMIEQLKAQLAETRVRADKAEQERNKLVAERQAAKFEAEAIQHRATSTMHDVSTAQLENDELRRQCSLKDNQILDLQSDRQTIQQELDQTNLTVAQLQQQLTARETDISTLQGELTSLRAQLDAASTEQNLAVRRLDDTDQQKTNVQREFQRLTVELSGMKERCEALHKELQQRVAASSALQREKAQVEEDKQRLRSELEKARGQVDALHQELLESQHEKETAQTQNVELRTLVRNVEASKEVLEQRLSSAVSEVQSRDERLTELQTIKRNYERELHEKNQRIKDLEQAIEAVDLERDTLQNMLDEEAERKQKEDGKLRHLSNELTRLENLVTDKSKDVEELTKRVTTKDRQLASAEARVNAVKSELLETRRAKQVKERELDSALQDLQLLTRENQAITAEIAGIANARNELMRELEEQRVRAARLDHALRTYEIEKKDLMTSIRGLAEEKRQVDRELEEAMYAKQRLNQTIQQLQTQLQHASAHFQANEAIDARHIADKVAMEKQLSGLSEKIVLDQRRMQALERDNQKLMQENFVLRQEAERFQQRLHATIQEASQSSDSSTTLRAQLAALRAEHGALHQQLVECRKHNSALEETIQEARAKEAIATNKSDMLFKQVQELQSTLDETKQRLQNAEATLEIASQRLQRSSSTTPGSDTLRSINRSRSSTSGSISHGERSPPSPLQLESAQTPVLNRLGLQAESRASQLTRERRLDDLAFGDDEDEGESLYIGKPTR